jgi:hypothetical protein
MTAASTIAPRKRKTGRRKPARRASPHESSQPKKGRPWTRWVDMGAIAAGDAKVEPAVEPEQPSPWRSPPRRRWERRL